MNSPDALIRQWQDEAARLDAEAARVRAAGEGGRYQIHGWETRAAALRDCAVELWQALTEDDGRDRAEHANVCSLPFGHEGGHWWDETQHIADCGPLSRCARTGHIDSDHYPGDPPEYEPGDPPMDDDWEALLEAREDTDGNT